MLNSVDRKVLEAALSGTQTACIKVHQRDPAAGFKSRFGKVITCADAYIQVPCAQVLLKERQKNLARLAFPGITVRYAQHPGVIEF